jgi:hypothetical protein
MKDAGARALRFVAARCVGAPLDPTLRITLNFHPDRTLPALVADGVYLSQFVTGTSNGGLTAYPGGDRWRWERRMFGGAYDDAPPHARPVYGALNFRRDPYGAAPRFGSAHLRLTAEALHRATFCYPDSFLEPTDFGVAARMPLIALAARHRPDYLDDYVEAHVHGPVLLDRDVEAVVLDPSYVDTELPPGLPVEWHPGFRLSVEELVEHADYRGQRYVDLGAALAVDGGLTPKVLRDAAGRLDPQDLKRVWHLVARFGRH